MLKFNVKVIPNAKRYSIVQEKELLKIYLTVPAVEGKANKVLVESLAKHFNVRNREVEIIKGLKSRNKIIKINDNSN